MRGAEDSRIVRHPGHYPLLYPECARIPNENADGWAVAAFYFVALLPLLHILGGLGAIVCGHVSLAKAHERVPFRWRPFAVLSLIGGYGYTAWFGMHILTTYVLADV